jgi:hypothetical protein
VRGALCLTLRRRRGQIGVGLGPRRCVSLLSGVEALFERRDAPNQGRVPAWRYDNAGADPTLRDNAGWRRCATGEPADGERAQDTRDQTDGSHSQEVAHGRIIARRRL